MKNKKEEYEQLNFIHTGSMEEGLGFNFFGGGGGGASSAIGKPNPGLKGSNKKPISELTPIEKMILVKSGISKNQLEEIKNDTDLSYDKLAEALSVTRATLINKKGDEKFTLQVSERIVGLADLYSYGYGVFEDEERFKKWMFTPNKALGGDVPYNLLDNQFGREEVRDVIGRIDYGVYS